MVLGRASATESFGLFGFDITEYEALFEEKLDLFMRLMREDRVPWSGRRWTGCGSAADAGRRHPGVDRSGALYAGGVETLARKIARIVHANHLSRFDLKYNLRHVPRRAPGGEHPTVRERVAPRVRELLEDGDDTWELTGRELAQITADGGPVRAS